MTGESIIYKAVKNFSNLIYGDIDKIYSIEGNRKEAIDFAEKVEMFERIKWVGL